METLLKERVINLEQMMADLIESFKERDKEWDRKMAEERAEAREEWDRKMKESREEWDRDLKKDRKEWERKLAEDRKEWNKKWGEVARKMGTIAEDIIAPGTESAVMKKFNTKVIDLSVRRKKKRGDLREEFDVIADTEDGKVFMIEVRSNPKSKDIDEVKEKFERFKKLFVEYDGKEIIPVYASLYINDSIIRYATKQGVYVIGMKGEFIEFLN